MVFDYAPLRRADGPGARSAPREQNSSIVVLADLARATSAAAL
ncbi:hypothetical protein [Frankia tisae]|nr:hypothetical protein [Frankia tisae]